MRRLLFASMLETWCSSQEPLFIDLGSKINNSPIPRRSPRLVSRLFPIPNDHTSDGDGNGNDDATPSCRARQQSERVLPRSTLLACFALQEEFLSL
jgi:hypothetical protein